MKWGAVEPQRGTYDWAAADRLVGFAKKNGQLVRGHTLVWHNQLPAWLDEDDVTPAELRKILHRHITDQVTHFKGRIWQWDVVNEAFDDDGTLRDSIWLRKLGPGYIADAFRWAHEADPKARLFINDHNIEGVNAKSTALYELVGTLRKQHVPVHGVGIQGHLAVQYSAPHDIADNMLRFDRLGLGTAITEADVRIPLLLPTARSTRPRPRGTASCCAAASSPRAATTSPSGASPTPTPGSRTPSRARARPTSSTRTTPPSPPAAPCARP